MSNALIVHKAHLPKPLLNVQAAQYVRMSTDRQQYSIQNQAAVIAAYAHAHSLTLVRTYKDEGESGLLLKNRTGLLQLLEDVESNQADFGHLLVYDVSRWGRFQDIDESAHYEFVCRRAGIKVAYCAEQFENDGSMLGSIVKNIKRVMAAEYSRELSAKVYAGQCRFARLGYKPCGRAGYALVRELVDEKMQTRRAMKKGERKYILTDHIRIRPGDPMEVAVVKWIFERFLEVKSETVIAWELNQKGLVSSTGAAWSRAAVGAVLRNESYIGNLIFNRKSQKLRQTAVKNPPEQWIRSEGCIEPIVDREVFFSVRKIIEERRVDLSEEEMLFRLRKALFREGRLTPTIIDRTPGLPCSATCQTHFGNFRNLYRLLGYTPKRNYEFLDARPIWSEFRSKLVEQAAAAIKAAGGRISSGGWSDCVRVNGMACLSVRAARWTPGQKPTHAPYWSIEREACLPHGWIAAIRLAEHNKAVLDYVLLPTDGKMKRTIRFSEKSRARRGITRFKTVNGLIQAVVRRLIKPDPTSHIAQGPKGKRPKAQPSKTKTIRRRR